MPDRNKILVEVGLGGEHRRGWLLGIASYVRTHAGCQVEMREKGSRPVEGTKKYVGVITEIDSSREAEEWAGMKIPVVDLAGSGLMENAIQIVGNDQAITGMVIEHFQERGFEHFGFVGICRSPSDRRYAAAFRRYFSAREMTGHVFNESDSLETWVGSLPRPVGLMVSNDELGISVLEICRGLGISVPGEVAIVVVDHDLPKCELSTPTMSAVEADSRRIGFLAAAAIMDMVNDRAPAPEQLMLIPPVQLVVRGSSDGMVVHDPVIAKAMRIIQDQARGRMNVGQLLSHLSVSRATLERRFLKAVGHSPREQILRVRLERARQLLAETDYDLATIAKMSGFKTAAHLSVRFKARQGKSPGQFRLMARN